MEPERFFWDRTRQVLEDLGHAYPLALADNRRAFVAPGIRVTPPLLFPVDPDVPDLAAYVASLPERPTLHLVVLLQAGAAALGVFDAGESLVTRAIKKYVVRGKGRAQPTYLKTKGKSRYGSRLRLQNARKLLIEINEKLTEWVERFGAPDRLYYNAPVRLWPELFRARVPPPFERDDTAIKIPLDLPVPSTEVLLRTYRRMSYGQIQCDDGVSGEAGGA